MLAGQKYTPDYGYISPLKTQKPCPNPAFADKHYHRVGMFRRQYLSDGLPGWMVDGMCVNCGRKFENKGFFIPREGDRNNG